MEMLKSVVFRRAKMPQERSVQEIFVAAINQERCVKGQDIEGPFHGTVIDCNLTSACIKLVQTAEFRILKFKDISEISLNGGGGGGGSPLNNYKK